jgi:hypothetical protein
MQTEPPITERRWVPFRGNSLDAVIDPRAAKLANELRTRGRKLLMGCDFTRDERGRWVGDCSPRWKTVRG